jgi:carbon storage regulator
MPSLRLRPFFLHPGVQNMLVLSRTEGEEIVIGDNIRVTVVAICGDRVRLGVTAPADIPILRDELHEAGVRLPARLAQRKARTDSAGDRG